MSVGYQCLLFLVTLSDEWGGLLLTRPVLFFLFCCVDMTDPTASPLAMHSHEALPPAHESRGNVFTQGSVEGDWLFRTLNYTAGS